MSPTQVWRPEDYDHQISFVSAYGKGLIELLAPRSGEQILDLGCGTGDLAKEISDAGAFVVGMDYSKEMISKAHEKYPSLHFITGNGENFNLDTPVDAVFSNAALHWMTNAEDTLTSVYQALKPEGRFVAEFGGTGNIKAIVNAIEEVLSSDYNIDPKASNPWYFPSIGEYTFLLEKIGFRVTLAHLFDRPTRLHGGKNGIKEWLHHFGQCFFTELTPEDQSEAFEKISQLTEQSLWKDDAFWADYKRLRVVAYK